MVLEDDLGEMLVRVRCLKDTVYGRRGDIAYIPERFAGGWVNKGLVVLIDNPAEDRKVRSSRKKSKKTGGAGKPDRELVAPTVDVVSANEDITVFVDISGEVSDGEDNTEI